MELEKLGPYRLGRKLGRGGMGTVYAAVHSQTGESAAVKILSPALAQEEGFRDRFEAEIESLKLLQHPHITRLFGWGEDQGQLFYAMELVEGPTLEDEIRQGRRFTWREVTEIGVQVAKALKHAHDHGVIHRDIKPANLMLAAEGFVKLSDFGIAKLFGNSGVTVDGGVLGTAEYMSPEQADGRMVTFRCDLYSLGGVLYALLAGRPPFRARNLPEMLQLQRFAAADPVRRYAPETPPELEEIVMQLLEKEPERRVTNAMLLARRLEATLHGLSLLEKTQQRRDDGADDAGSAEDETGFLTGRARSEPRVGETNATQAVTGADFSEAVTAAAPISSAFARDTAATLAAQVTENPDEGNAASFSLAPSAVESRGAPAPPPARPAPKPSRFTTVEQSQREAETSESQAARWVHVGLLALAIGCVSALGWYLASPPSAAALYRTIQAAATAETTEGLMQAEAEMKRFVEVYPNDPRRDEVQGYLDELRDYRSQRRTRRQVERLARKPNRTPIERAFLEADRLADDDPAAALAKFEALVVLFAPGAEESKYVGELILLARQRIESLREEIARLSDEHRTELTVQMDRAGALAGDDLSAARTIWQAVLTLYGGQPWAASEVAEARRRLEETVDAPVSRD